MISIKKTKELIGDKNISNEEAEQIRKEFCDLGELIFESWLKDRKTKNKI